MNNLQSILHSHTFKQTISGIIIVIFGIAGLWLAMQFPGKNSEINVPLQSIYADYDSLSNLQELVLLKDIDSSAKNKDAPDFSKTIATKGDFSKIYLYAEASVDSKPLTDWDSIYVKFNMDHVLKNLDSGGHLFRPKSLPVPGNKAATALLYNTSVVPYLPTIPYSEARIPVYVDWYDKIFRSFSNEDHIINFMSFLSTTESGHIIKISLYYKCANETPNCYINIK